MARILIVDDDQAVRKVIARMLAQAGHDAVALSNGASALRAYREHRADLVISDMFMPETDGIEMTMCLRREFPDAKVLAMSGGGGRFDKNMMLEAASVLGAARILAKPFEQSDLLNLVQEVLVDQ